VHPDRPVPFRKRRRLSTALFQLHTSRYRRVCPCSDRPPEIRDSPLALSALETCRVSQVCRYAPTKGIRPTREVASCSPTIVPLSSVEVPRREASIDASGNPCRRALKSRTEWAAVARCTYRLIPPICRRTQLPLSMTRRDLNSYGVQSLIGQQSQCIIQHHRQAHASPL
jgi:hypothetical protein